MKRFFYTLFILMTVATSCKQNTIKGFGSKAEAERNLKIEDSINREKERIHLEMVEAGQERYKLKLQNQIDQLKQELWSARQKLDEINEFQFGRLRSEKERQLATQNAKIGQLQSYIRGYENILPKLGVFKTHDFHKSPESLLNALFNLSKNRDFSNFQYLVDPYAEGDDDIYMFVIMDGAPNDIKNQMASEFGNGRIMSEIQYFEDDKAMAEIAIGASSNQLKKITLVNRMGAWYLYSF